MAQAHEHISKGYYKYSQIHHFVSVKNYIFIHENNKKCLLLRFSNDFDHKVDAMTFTVIQMNAVGQVLGQSDVELQYMNLQPGGMYTPGEGVVVNDNCNDFKVVIKEVFSGHYRYTIRNRTIISEYLRTPMPSLPPAAENTPKISEKTHYEFRGFDDDETEESAEQTSTAHKNTLTVRVKKNARTGRLAFLALIVLLVIIGCKFLELWSNWSI